MRNFRLWFALLLVILVAAACGGSKKSPSNAPSATPIPAVTREIVTIPPISPTPLPATWTPKPTLTLPAHVTIEYTYQAPTMPSFVPPTYTASPSPTPPPPTATPVGPAVVIPGSLLNQALAAQLPPEASTYIDGAPAISFQNNMMVVAVKVLGTPGDTTSGRMVVIQVAVTVGEQGKLTLSKTSASYADDKSAFALPLADQLTQSLQQIVDATLVQLYNQASPNAPRFYVSGVAITTEGLTVQTVTLPG